MEDFSVNFEKRTGIKTIISTIPEIYKNCSFSVSCNNNNFVSYFNDIDFEQIRLCYINSGIAFYNDLFDFKSKADKEYASQEWNAALLCLLSSTKNIKFINPFLKKYALDTEFEHNLMFKKFNLDTVEIFLTNNSENFLTFYDIYKNNLIIKNIISRSNRKKLFKTEDLKRLDKLYLSPY
ncbi:MAG: hypothetical protein LUG16_00215, partial [Candidatus Gastranaerophilales bacterium]|nr:hypothetical protein [Candidatus Gastranaerophilales bacterium]